jgi:DNA gyrase subunit A
MGYAQKYDQAAAASAGATYQVDKKHGHIDTELPYSTTVEAISMTNNLGKPQIREINELRDRRSGCLNQTSISRGQLTRRIDAEAIQNDFAPSNFPSTSIFDCGHPRVMGVNEIINEWTSWRRGCLFRELSFELART